MKGILYAVGVGPGDPEFYSTFFYIADIIKGQGFDMEIINGITSFSAVGASLKLPLALGREPVMISSGEYIQNLSFKSFENLKYFLSFLFIGIINVLEYLL